MLPPPLSEKIVKMVALSLQLQITHCTGLARTDRFGLLNPFCVVTWPDGEQETGRTPTIYNTVRPVWKACSFELPLLTPEQAEKLHKGGCRWSGGGEGDNCDCRGNPATRNRKSKRAGSDPREQGADIELKVQVFDEDEGGAACFLGELNFGADALLELARARQNLVSHDTSILMLHRIYTVSPLRTAPTFFGINCLELVWDHFCSISSKRVNKSCEKTEGRHDGGAQVCQCSIVVTTGRYLATGTSAIRESLQPSDINTYQVELSPRATRELAYHQLNHPLCNTRYYRCATFLPESPKELPLEAKHDGTLTSNEHKIVQGSIGLGVSAVTDGALPLLQGLVDAKKIFLEVKRCFQDRVIGDGQTTEA